MCRRVEHVGPVGAGASMKLAINLPLLVFWQAFGEALALCRPLGLDPARLVDIFADTSGGPNVLKGRGAVLAAALQGKDTGPDHRRRRRHAQGPAHHDRRSARAGHAASCRPPARWSATTRRRAPGLGKGDITAIPVRWMTLRKTPGAGR